MVYSPDFSRNSASSFGGQIDLPDRSHRILNSWILGRVDSLCGEETNQEFSTLECNASNSLPNTAGPAPVLPCRKAPTSPAARNRSALRSGMNVNPPELYFAFMRSRKAPSSFSAFTLLQSCNSPILLRRTIIQHVCGEAIRRRLFKYPLQYRLRRKRLVQPVRRSKNDTARCRYPPRAPGIASNLSEPSIAKCIGKHLARDLASRDSATGDDSNGSGKTRLGHFAVRRLWKLARSRRWRSVERTP